MISTRKVRTVLGVLLAASSSYPHGVRYTIDPLDFPSEDLPGDDPLMVEVLGVDETVRKIRDHAGNVVGGAIGGTIGRPRLRLVADSELLARIQPLRDALRDLDDHMTAVHTVHRADGSEPETPEEEAEIRMAMRFDVLAAHALLAVELEASE